MVRFFADYYALLDSWAAWASNEIGSWDDIARPGVGDGPLEALRDSIHIFQSLAEPAALRPARR